MKKISVPVVNKSKNTLPSYESEGASGIDLKASLERPVEILPFQTVIIPTDCYMQIPKGYEMQVRPRSGLAVKYGISVMNAPGTIDADFRGNISIILVNFGKNTFIVNNGDRIAQGVFCPIVKVKFKAVSDLETTNRGSNGFGSTGI
jgi:dUTP pyrophosphatase